ncbi:hypothetical protein GGH92_005556 [Coemansia sp. RSA 2673]|nr:hypothetical protein GGH92_005556 [Coemansia sp. RSA 2673]
MKYIYSLALVAMALASTSNAQKYLTAMGSFRNNAVIKTSLYPRYTDPTYPVLDVNSPDMVCRTPDMSYQPTPFQIYSDDTLFLQFDMDTNPAIISDDKKGQHIWGPCIVYMAEASATSSALKWFKVFEYAGDKDRWCSESIALDGTVLQVPMKKNLKTGYYIVRTEIIGLNMADGLSSNGNNMGAQFYPSCGLIAFTNVHNRTKVPETTVSIPGVYKATDPSLLLKAGIFNTKAVSYTIPGPAEFDPPKRGHPYILLRPETFN